MKFHSPFTKESCQLPLHARCSSEADSKRTSSLGGPRRLDSLKAWSTDWSVRSLVTCGTTLRLSQSFQSGGGRRGTSAQDMQERSLDSECGYFLENKSFFGGVANP
jgi:hypothetical protein